MESGLGNIAAGQLALKRADWPGAKARFEAALRDQDSPEAHDGLGIACWWLNEIDLAHQHRTAAYVGFKQRGDPRRAALLAAWMAREQVFLHANTSAMRGWFARAERLIQQAGACPEAGWFAIFRASMLAPSAELAETAIQALAIAREHDDPDLEATALAFRGLARVTLGEIDAGMAHLDEAMAMVIASEVASFMAISEIFCVLLSACALAGDLVRTDHWCHAAAEFAQRYQCSFLSGYCRTTYGGLLADTGRWREAEAELTEAIEAFARGHSALRVHAVLKLADLRVSQGRLEEAEVLLADYADYGGAAIPRARIHLARGEASLARAVLEQALGDPAALTLERAPLLVLLVETLLVLGELSAADNLAQALMAFAQSTGSNLLLAQSEFVTARVKQHAGDADAARWYQAVLERLRSYEQSLLANRARLAMARALKGTDHAAAVTWARAALAAFERIGAAHEADEAGQLLRELGAAGRLGPRQRELLTQREAEVLALIARGLTNREIAERLVISAKTVEHHVSQILGKLGLRSRAEAAAFAASHPSGATAGPAFDHNRGS